MRLIVNVEDITVEIESDTDSPSFDTVETLLNRAADTALHCWWEINGGDDDDTPEVLAEAETPQDNA